jgi:hypothetical protein
MHLRGIPWVAPLVTVLRERPRMMQAERGSTLERFVPTTRVVPLQRLLQNVPEGGEFSPRFNRLN